MRSGCKKGVNQAFSASAREGIAPDRACTTHNVDDPE